MKRNSLSLAVYAILLALTVVLGWIPYGGLFLLPILFASCCFGYKQSFIASIMFGLVSLAFVFMLPNMSAIGQTFREQPWIPVVPRLFIGPVAHSVYLLSKKLIKEKGILSKIIPISITAVVGTITNTVLVGLCMFIASNYLDPGLQVLTMIELVVAGSIEVVILAIVTPPVVKGVKKAMPRLFKEINAKNNQKV